MSHLNSWSTLVITIRSATFSPSLYTASPPMIKMLDECPLHSWSAAPKEPQTVAPWSWRLGLRLSTMFFRLGSGLRGRESHVLRPMITVWPNVRRRKKRRSAGIFHGILPFIPMPRLGQHAATTEIMSLEMWARLPDIVDLTTAADDFPVLKERALPLITPERKNNVGECAQRTSTTEESDCTTPESIDFDHEFPSPTQPELPDTRLVSPSLSSSSSVLHSAARRGSPMPDNVLPHSAAASSVSLSPRSTTIPSVSLSSSSPAAAEMWIAPMPANGNDKGVDELSCQETKRLVISVPVPEPSGTVDIAGEEYKYEHLSNGGMKLTRKRKGCELHGAYASSTSARSTSTKYDPHPPSSKLGTHSPSPSSPKRRCCIADPPFSVVVDQMNPAIGDSGTEIFLVDDGLPMVPGPQDCADCGCSDADFQCVRCTRGVCGACFAKSRNLFAACHACSQDRAQDVPL